MKPHVHRHLPRFHRESSKPVVCQARGRLRLRDAGQRLADGEDLRARVLPELAVVHGPVHVRDLAEAEKHLSLGPVRSVRAQEKRTTGVISYAVSEGSPSAPLDYGTRENPIVFIDFP